MACLYLANKFMWLVGEIVFPGGELFVNATSVRQIVVGSIGKFIWENFWLNIDFNLATIFSGLLAWILLVTGCETLFWPIIKIGKKGGIIGIVTASAGLWVLLRTLVSVAIVFRIVMVIRSGDLSVINV